MRNIGEVLCFWGEVVMSSENEIWQVEIQGEVYEADLPTLKEWAYEGRLYQNDRVKKGSLSWIEAGRVPALRKVFSGDEQPPFRSEALAEPAASPAPEQQVFYRPEMTAPPSSYSSQCLNHPDMPAAYICRMCSGLFCKTCPKSVGSAYICPACGDLCQKYEQAQQQVARAAAIADKSFGMKEFGEALKYPFTNPVSLIMSGMFYAVMSMGGLYGKVISIVVLFGCISLVIKKVAGGDTKGGFVPDFTEFSMWDDVVKPVFLSIAVSIVTLGPVVLLGMLTIWGWMGSVQSEREAALNAEVENAKEDPRKDPLDLRELVEQKNPEADERARRQLQELSRGQKITDDSVKLEEDEEKAPPSLADSMPVVQLILPFLAKALPILVVMFLGLAWAAFYYPMALAVAGFTQDFWSVLNPMVGLDTIKRMGGVYLKAFGMYIMIVFLEVALNFGAMFMMGIVLAIPLVGYFASGLIEGIIKFYVSLVLAFVLGMSLFKCADELHIQVS